MLDRENAFNRTYRLRLSITFAAVAAWLLGLALPGPANAASFSFTVNTTADSHDAAPGNGACADSSGLCSLRAGLEEANALPARTTVTITVPAGTYKLTLGQLAVARNAITISGVGAAKTIVQQSRSGGVVAVASGAKATLHRLELRGRGSNGSSGCGLTNAGTTSLTNVRVARNSAASGAGITNQTGATLTLTSTTVSNNFVTQPADSQPAGSGGGILNAGSLTLLDSTVTGNYAGEGGFGLNDTGGAGGNGGGIDNTGALSVTGGKITGNYAGPGGPGENEVPGDGGSGGGIYSSAGTVTLTSATISANVAGAAGPELTGDGPANAGNGGGVFNSAKLTVSGSTFSGNKGSVGQDLGSDGGGIYNSGKATISSSSLTGNVSGVGDGTSGYGGGIANVGRLTFTNSTLANNSAATGGNAGNGRPGGNGGGLYQGGGTATLNRDALTGNTSGNGGAGVYCEPCFSYGGPGGIGGAVYSTATLSLKDTTLSGNSVGVGGANAPPLGGSGPPGIGAGLATAGGTANLLYVTVADNTDGIDRIAGTVTLGGTIVADSTGTNDLTADNCTGTIAETTGFNLDSGATCGFSLASDITQKEPRLGALAANGGPTLTQALQAGSPAIDHGGTSTTGCPSIDQRGVPRPDETADHGSCDVGAYESTI
jgi:CSLREA domain-containing protein